MVVAVLQLAKLGFEGEQERGEGIGDLMDKLGFADASTFSETLVPISAEAAAADFEPSARTFRDFRHFRHFRHSRHFRNFRNFRNFENFRRYQFEDINSEVSSQSQTSTNQAPILLQTIL